jgi:hypothetical protein
VRSFGAENSLAMVKVKHAECGENVAKASRIFSFSSFPIKYESTEIDRCLALAAGSSIRCLDIGELAQAMDFTLSR